jgi:hypothetical protein
MLYVFFKSKDQVTFSWEKKTGQQLSIFIFIYFETTENKGCDTLVALPFTFKVS